MSAAQISRLLAETKPTTSNSGTVVAIVVMVVVLAAAATVVVARRRRGAARTAERTVVPSSEQPPSPIVDPQVIPQPPNAAVAAKAATVFLSYRREDSADVAGRIYDRLAQAFGHDQVFKDVDSIPLGVDFREHLQQMVGRCDVLLAVIGDEWLGAGGSPGSSRLDDPKDFVRIELEGALDRGIPVIPVLVRGAAVPREDQLPSTLSTLTYRSGLAVRADPDFHRDMDRLVEGVRRYVT